MPAQLMGKDKSTLQNDRLNEMVEKTSELVVLEIENFLLKKKNEKK